MLVIRAAVAVAIASICAAAVPAMMGAPSEYRVGKFGSSCCEGDFGLEVELSLGDVLFWEVGDDTDAAVDDVA